MRSNVIDSEKAENMSDKFNNQQENEGNEIKENYSKTTTEVYPLRWWIGAFFGLQLVLIRMIMNSFGIVNNIYKAYFNISYYAIDWFTLIQIVGTIASSILLALLTFNAITKFRKLFIIMVSLTLLSCSTLLVSFAYPFLYGLIYLGQFVIGFSWEVSNGLIIALASNWFPENQSGIAMTFQSLGMAVGAFLAFLILGHLVTPPPNNFSNVTNTTWQFENTTDEISFSNWQVESQRNFLFFYSCVLLICVIIIIFTLIFVSDYPPKPPSIAQALLRAQNKQSQPNNILKNFGNFVSACKSLMFDKVMFLAVLICYIPESLNDLQRLLMGQILRDVFIARNSGSSVNAMSGYALMVYEVGSFIGYFISGLLVDFCKKHSKLILYVALLATTAANIGLAVGYYYHSAETVFIFIALFGIALGLCRIPILGMIVEHTYPTNPAFVFLLFDAEGEIVVVIISQICRLLLDFIDVVAVFVFMILLIILSMILTAFLNPKYKKQEACQSACEEQQLLHNNTEVGENTVASF